MSDSTIDLSGTTGWTNAHTVVYDLRDNNVFLGVPNVTQNTLPVIDPFIGGYGRVWCLQSPVFFEPNLRGLWQRMVERYCRGLSGLSNYELQTTDITYGNTAETYTVATGIKRGNNQFNLKFQELQGGLFRNMSKYWVTGISDLGSGYGTYHGKVFDGSNLRFSAVNHTSIMLYALTDNSGGAYGLEALEFACLWFAAFPTSVPNSHLEYSVGEHNTTDIDMAFNGIYHENNTINTFAANMLQISNFYKDNYDNFNLGPITINSASRSEDDSAVETAGIEPMQGGAGPSGDYEGSANQYDNLVSEVGMVQLQSDGE